MSSAPTNSLVAWHDKQLFALHQDSMGADGSKSRETNDISGYVIHWIWSLGCNWFVFPTNAWFAIV